MTIYGRFGEKVTLLRMGTLADVKKLDLRYQDGRREGLQAFHQALAQMTNKFREGK